MSRYTQIEETEIVCDAMTLTETIIQEQQELENVKNEGFNADTLKGDRGLAYRTKPHHPEKKKAVRTIIEPELPEAPKSDMSFGKYVKLPLAVIVICGILGAYLIELEPSGLLKILAYILIIPFGGGFITLGILYSKYSKKKEQIEQDLLSSPEYLAKVAEAENRARIQQEEADRATEQQQRELDEKYQEEMKIYENETLPKFNHALAKWKENKEERIQYLESDIQFNKDALDALYDETKIISLTYREPWILRWLYNDMITSDHDIRYASELLDRNRNRAQNQELIDQVKNQIDNLRRSVEGGFARIHGQLEETNATLGGMSTTMNKMRFENNIGNTVQIAQKYKTNQMLKKYFEE